MQRAFLAATVLAAVTLSACSKDPVSLTGPSSAKGPPSGGPFFLRPSSDDKNPRLDQYTET
jgi:hypothetical protein